MQTYGKTKNSSSLFHYVDVEKLETEVLLPKKLTGLVDTNGALKEN